MSSFDVFQREPLVDSFLPEDRRALVRYLWEYLTTGKIEEPPQLHTSHKQIRVDERREPIGQVTWKWSELSGKYAGCAFWSTEALRVVIGLDARWPGRPLKRVCERVSKGYFLESIQHEHVFPREELLAKLQALVKSTAVPPEPELEALLDRYCIGCVVTRQQHDEAAGRPGNSENPWLRYRETSICLVPNPAWTEPHLSWIRAAGLLEPR